VAKHFDDDGDGFADQSDAQSRAFRQALPSDRIGDAELPAWGVARHLPPPDHNTLLAEIKLPEEWEDEEWDQQATGPKTLGEARIALAARITDPTASDSVLHASAYDDPGPMTEPLGEGEAF
jgi:hypothetical protein